MQTVRIYKYPTRMTAVLITGKERNHNMPIQNSKIKLYKGANQPLDFTIFDADGKPLTYDGTGKHLEFKVFNKHTNKLIMTKRLIKQATVSQPVAGALTPSVRRNNHIRSVYRVIVESTDTKDLEPGSQYRWVVQENDKHYNAQYFFSGLGHEVEGELFISNEAAPTVELSNELKAFTSLTDHEKMDQYIVGDLNNTAKLKWTRFASEAAAGDVQHNVVDGLHTAALYLQNFTGIVQLQATLDINLPDGQADHRWFNIPTRDGTVNHVFNNHTGVEPLNFVGNFMWIRVVYYQMDPASKKNGELKRILIRR